MEKNIAEDILENSKSIPGEFRKLVDDNFWELTNEDGTLSSIKEDDDENCAVINPSPKLAAAVYFKKGYDAAVDTAIMWQMRRGTTNIDLSEFVSVMSNEYINHHEKWLEEKLEI